MAWVLAVSKKIRCDSGLPSALEFEVCGLGKEYKEKMSRKKVWVMLVHYVLLLLM